MPRQQRKIVQQVKRGAGMLLLVTATGTRQQKQAETPSDGSTMDRDGQKVGSTGSSEEDAAAQDMSSTQHSRCVPGSATR